MEAQLILNSVGVLLKYYVEAFREFIWREQICQRLGMRHLDFCVWKKKEWIYNNSLGYIKIINQKHT